jgi:hypothetical protein
MEVVQAGRAQDLPGRRLHARIEVNRVHELTIREPVGDLHDGSADRAEVIAQVLAAVSRDEDQVRVRPIQHPSQDAVYVRWAIPDLLKRSSKGIDHRISGDEHLLLGDPLAQKILAAGFRRSEVERGQRRDEDAVRLLWPG